MPFFLFDALKHTTDMDRDTLAESLAGEPRFLLRCVVVNDPYAVA